MRFCLAAGSRGLRRGSSTYSTGTPLRLHGGDDLVALDLEHARIVRALHDEQRPRDLRRRGTAARCASRRSRSVAGSPISAYSDSRKLAHHGGMLSSVRTQFVTPKMSMPTSNASGAKASAAQHHVAAVAAADDADALAVDPVELLEVAASRRTQSSRSTSPCLRSSRWKKVLP